MQNAAFQTILLVFLISGSNGQNETTPQTTNQSIPAGQCGRQHVTPRHRSRSRIIGGGLAIPHSWPWQVAVLTDEDKCGGSLIDSRHVITAAHCTEGKVPAAFKVIAGVDDLERAETDDFVQVLKVEKIINHPQFGTPKNVSNDIAILRLSSVVQFNTNVTPICLPQQDVAVGTYCVTTGWGETRGTANNRFLQQVFIRVVPLDTCNGTESYNGIIESTMLCAGLPGRDSCEGDSGGPLVHRRPEGVWELQGVTSFGDVICGTQNPGVYTRITAFIDWIKQNVKV